MRISRKTFKYFLLTGMFLCALILPDLAIAKEIKFEVSADRDIVSLGESIQLSLQFHGSTDVPAPDLPEIGGVKPRYVGPSTMMSIVNGRMSSSITHIYRFVPLKTGKFKIGPISFDHKGDHYVSNELTIEVKDTAHGQTAPSPHYQQKSQTALKDRLFLEMKTGKTKAYLNEVVPLTIKLYISSLSVRDVQYPRIDLEGFSSGEFGKPRQYQEDRNGVTYDVVEFKKDIFATKSGELTLGPALLETNIAVKKQTRRRSSPFDDFFGGNPFDDFFGRYELEPVELRSDELKINVLPLPEHDRPADFTGAVGDFSFDVEVSPAQVKAGDPISLKMNISGSGNFKTVTSPELKRAADFKTYEPQVKSEDGRKIFEQILIPENERVKEVPAVSFSFFNPSTGRYQTISRGPVPISVTAPEKKEEIALLDSSGSGAVLAKKETLGRDIIYIKESPGSLRRKGGYLYKNTTFLLLQIAPLLVFVSVYMIKKRRDRLTSDIRYARRLKAPGNAKKGIRGAEQHMKRGDVGGFYDSVFNTMRQYIGDRFHLPTGGITSDIIDNVLKEKNIGEDVLVRLRNIFRECDLARYAPAELEKASMEKTLQALKEIIDHLERHKA